MWRFIKLIFELTALGMLAFWPFGLLAALGLWAWLVAR